MWKIRYSEEVENYFFGDRDLGMGLMRVLAEFMISDDGLPPSHYEQDNRGEICWETMEHEIYYSRDLAKKEIFVGVIKPL